MNEMTRKIASGGGVSPEELNRERIEQADRAFQASVKVEQAVVILQMAISENQLDAKPDEFQRMALGANFESLAMVLDVIDDILHQADALLTKEVAA